MIKKKIGEIEAIFVPDNFKFRIINFGGNIKLQMLSVKNKKILKGNR